MASVSMTASALTWCDDGPADPAPGGESDARADSGDDARADVGDDARARSGDDAAADVVDGAAAGRGATGGKPAGSTTDPIGAAAAGMLTPRWNHVAAPNRCIPGQSTCKRDVQVAVINVCGLLRSLDS
jgi:hypothetical protein